MLFNSFPFVFIFLPAALLGFYACAAINTTMAKVWLVLTSLAFYTYWHPPFTVVLLVSVVFNYTMGSLILGLREQDRQKPLLIFAVTANLLLLFYYKYAYWMAASLFHLGVTPEPFMDRVLLPLGISFFTFTQIGFLLDCSGGEVKDRSPVNYLLFVTFFPHLIAGPILHHREIMPQFADDATYHLRPDNVAQGGALFAIGLFKKVLIADSIATYASPGFADPGSLGLFGAWGAALCYTLQLYFDFSGYSDMAVGIAKMCNVQFPFNFNSPYRAANIIDFWQRWHMTLTRYLNLYLYNPVALWVTRRRVARGLPVSRKAMAHFWPFTTTVALPMFFTMSLAGIWHGAGSQFLIFGLLHASYLTINHAWRVFGPRHRKDEMPTRRRHLRVAGCVLLTYVAVLIGMVFFRAESTPAGVSMVAGMIGLHGIDITMPVPMWLPSKLGMLGVWLQGHGLIQPVGEYEQGGAVFIQLAMMTVLYAIVFLAPNSQHIVGMHGGRHVVTPRPMAEDPEPGWLRMNASWGVITGVVLIAAILGIGAKSEFLYFQF
jgi:alginate O-acetyltransferase complex protein AlgI